MAPAVFLLILIGLLPFVWSVVVSFQNLAGANRAGSFVGFTSRMMAGAVAGSTSAVTAIAATNLRRRR